MKRTILPSIAAMIFAVAVAGAQVPPMPQSPTTPQAPPPALPAPTTPAEPGAPDRGAPAEGSTAMADLELKLTGCLGQSGSGGFVLEKAYMSETDAEATSGRDAAVTQDVALQGASAELRPHVGHLVEVHGNFEQGAVNDKGQPILNVAEVEMVADNCDRPAR